ncbi:MAG: hypothetical protein HYZ42_14395 [Bacteroidetes bacterium]|nr:hypothetical protein [Bacteroidota bacterium]
MSEGLTSVEVKERVAKFGYNELISAKPKSIWHIAFEVMKEPMFILLISCGILYMIVGDRAFLLLYSLHFINIKKQRKL